MDLRSQDTNKTSKISLFFKIYLNVIIKHVGMKHELLNKLKIVVLKNVYRNNILVGILRESLFYNITESYYEWFCST